MSNAAVDRNLLFGIVALQMDFITRDALIESLRDWTTQKGKPLGEILVGRGDLSAARRELLELLVDEHVRQHNHDPAASLASVSSISDATIDWQRIEDIEIQDSLAARRIARDAVASGGKSELKTDGTTASLGRFRVLRPHARGGIGEVFLAFDEELHREVALKEIQSRHLKDDSHRERFVREAEVTGGLEHPGIVPVYSLGHHGDGRPFYAMRFIRGDSLKEAIERFHAETKHPAPVAAQIDVNTPTVIGAAPPDASAAITTPGQREYLVSREKFESVEFRKLLGRFIDVCQAIEYAHSRGVLHRDLKPGNIMLGRYGETLVVDWGLAKIAGKDERFANADEATLVPSSGSSIEHTADGSVIGTPAYMSPEQAAGRLDQLGPATDVYSLGATLYHVLTGRSPFDKLPLEQLLPRVQHGEFPRPDAINPHVPQALTAVCLKAMALLAENRYDSSSAIAEDLEHWLADEPVNACRETMVTRASRWIRKHRAWAMSGTAALALVAVVATISAVLINGQKDVIARQERAATKLAARNATLAADKSKLADEKSRLADDKSKLAEEKSNLAALESVARKQADQNAEDARRQTRLAERNLYNTHMNLVQVAWGEARIDQAQRLLELYRPAAGKAGGLNDPRGLEWYYWNRLCHSELLSLKGHKDVVTCVEFSPDGRQLASASLDGTVKYWNPATGDELLTLPGTHGSGGTVVAFTRDGKRLATARELIDVNDNNSRQAVFKVWDVPTGKELITWNGHQNRVESVAYTPDGLHLASASSDQTIKIWDAATGRELHTLNGHHSIVTHVEFSPDGKQLASASLWNGSVKVWDANTGQAMLSLNGLYHVAFGPDGKRIAATDSNGNIKVLDSATGTTQLELVGNFRNHTRVTYSPDGMRIAAGGGDRTVKIWDAITGRFMHAFKGHDTEIRSLAFSPNGQLLATSSWDGTVKLWNAEVDPEALTLTAHDRSPADIKQIMSTTPIFSSVGVNCVAFHRDGRRLATASDDGTVKLWDVETRQRLISFEGHSDSVNGVAFSPDGRRLASASADMTVRVWDVETGEEMLILSGHTSPVTSVAFSPDGQWLGSTGGRFFDADSPGEVRVWDATTGKDLRTFIGHKYAALNAAFSPDGRWLASAGGTWRFRPLSPGEIKLWHADSGTDSRTLSGHAGGVKSVVFSPDGKRLASASEDQTIKLWDPATGKVLLTLEGHTSPVCCVAFTPDRNRLVSASVFSLQQGQMKVWDVSTGQELLTLNSDYGGANHLSISPDGQRIAAGHGDGTVRVWDVRQWTPDLKADQQAVSLVWSLFKTGLSMDDVLAAISSDRSIAETVRQRALQIARVRK